MSDTQTIPVQPQTRLFVANLVIQPLMTALFVWMTMGADGWGMRLFGGALALMTAGLLLFSVLVVSRTWGKTFAIDIGPSTLRIPLPLKGVVTALAWQDISRATLHETKTAAKSFWAMNIHHHTDGAEQVTVVNSQLLGDDAFHALRNALSERGVLGA